MWDSWSKYAKQAQEKIGEVGNAAKLLTKEIIFDNIEAEVASKQDSQTPDKNESPPKRIKKKGKNDLKDAAGQVKKIQKPRAYYHHNTSKNINKVLDKVKIPIENEIEVLDSPTPQSDGDDEDIIVIKRVSKQLPPAEVPVQGSSPNLPGIPEKQASFPSNPDSLNSGSSLGRSPSILEQVAEQVPPSMPEDAKDSIVEIINESSYSEDVQQHDISIFEGMRNPSNIGNSLDFEKVKMLKKATSLQKKSNEIEGGRSMEFDNIQGNGAKTMGKDKAGAKSHFFAQPDSTAKGDLNQGQLERLRQIAFALEGHIFEDGDNEVTRPHIKEVNFSSNSELSDIRDVEEGEKTSSNNHFKLHISTETQTEELRSNFNIEHEDLKTETLEIHAQTESPEFVDSEAYATIDNDDKHEQTDLIEINTDQEFKNEQTDVTPESDLNQISQDHKHEQTDLVEIQAAQEFKSEQTDIIPESRAIQISQEHKHEQTVLNKTVPVEVQTDVLLSKQVAEDLTKLVIETAVQGIQTLEKEVTESSFQTEQLAYHQSSDSQTEPLEIPESKEEELESLRKEIEDLTRTIDSIKEANFEIEQDLRNQHSVEIEDLESRISEKDAKIKEFESSDNEKDQIVIKLKGELAAKENTIQTLQSQAAKHNDELMGDISRLSSELNTLRVDKETFRHDKEEAIQSLTRTKMIVADLEKTLKSTKSELGSSKNLLDELAQKLAKLTTEREELSGQKLSLEKLLTESRKKEASYASEIEIMQVEALNLGERIKMLQNRYEHMSKELDIEKSSRIKAEREIKQLESTLADYKIKSNSDKLSHEEVLQLKQEIHSLENKLQETLQNEESMRDSFENIQELLENAQEEIEELTISQNKLYCEIEVNRKEEARLKKHLEDINVKSSELQQKAKDDQKIIQQLKEEISLIENEKNEIKKDTSELIEKIKADSTPQDTIIDKKVIGSFLLNFFDLSTSKRMQAELLETLSRMLDFDDQQMAKIGMQKLQLKKEAEQEEKQATDSNSETSSFSDNFIKFLKGS